MLSKFLRLPVTRVSSAALGRRTFLVTALHPSGRVPASPASICTCSRSLGALPCPVRSHAVAARKFATIVGGAWDDARITGRFKVDETTPQFFVTPANGFLPRQDPLEKLPDSFAALESLLNRMPIDLPDGSHGLLATGKFGAAVEAELPLYEVDHIMDTRLLTALFRDYTFAASAYLLEPCDLRFRQTGEYGIGREVLPKNIAVPLAKVAAKIGARPFMEYAQSYSLFNYKRNDPSKPLDYDNLSLVRAFHGTTSEHGFILTHVAMVRHSPGVVKHTLDILDAAGRSDRQSFDVATRGLLNVMREINRTMDTMWNVSATTDYMKFRTFIMGTKSQPMFPRGVIYDGVSDEPMFFRGESGANDSIIPTCDNLLQLTADMPHNPLTEILKDFRSYRPADHNAWLTSVEERARSFGVREFAERDDSSAVVYLALLDQVREFRGRHWNFTKEYIIKHTNHPVATGGSPIVTWLPNQLATVLRAIGETSAKIDSAKVSDPADRKLLEEVRSRAEAQSRILEREVATLKTRFADQDQLAKQQTAHA
ncbi:hypothetical protein BJ742DRAFT_795266 [Cladochytrium replicatum]|nr:hypothetical protein BJ742DRAFT_795266 [Cladochytrium replicatum]